MFLYMPTLCFISIFLVTTTIAIYRQKFVYLAMSGNSLFWYNYKVHEIILLEKISSIFSFSSKPIWGAYNIISMKTIFSFDNVFNFLPITFISSMLNSKTIAIVAVIGFVFLLALLQLLVSIRKWLPFLY